MSPNVVKSIRIDDELSKLIEKDTNFSNLANHAIKEYLNKGVWLPNLEIEKHANIKAEQVQKRVSNVKYLRSSETAIVFTLYPTSEDVIKRNQSIYEYANGSYNSLHDGFVYFNVKFPVNFLLFLRSRKWDSVDRCIVGFLSLLYWEDKEHRHIMEEQLERNTMKAVLKAVNSNLFDDINKIHKNYYKKGGALLRAQYNKLYLKLAVDLGIDPIMFPFMRKIFSHIQYPIHMSEHIPFENNDFEIKLSSGYMRDIYEETDDWMSIVVKGNRGGDDLHRAESDEKPWINWIQEYTFYHSLKYNIPK